MKYLPGSISQRWVNPSSVREGLDCASFFIGSPQGLYVGFAHVRLGWHVRYNELSEKFDVRIK